VKVRVDDIAEWELDLRDWSTGLVMAPRRAGFARWRAMINDDDGRVARKGLGAERCRDQLTSFVRPWTRGSGRRCVCGNDGEDEFGNVYQTLTAVDLRKRFRRQYFDVEKGGGRSAPLARAERLVASLDWTGALSPGKPPAFHLPPSGSGKPAIPGTMVLYR
jgi:hypothetical protein